MKKLVNKALVVLGLCTSYLLAAQQPDGWIQFNQNYIKLKVTQDNYYRVTSAELQAAGYPTTSVAVSQLKLYRRGNEVNIRTVANADGVTLSYLEFWGEKNDGKTDTDLYLPAAQPHQAYNLFTDTATYFLTWSSTTSTRRIVPSGINNNTGLIPEAYHLARERILQTSVYSPGRQFGPGSVQKLSDYDAGEGFTGAFLSKNSAQTFTFTLTDRVIGSVNPHVEAVIVGGNSLTHRVQVEAGPDATSLVTIDTLTFDGYTHFNYQKEIPASRVGITGSLLIRFKALGIADAADRVSLALVDVVYPQQLVVPVSGQKIFTLEKNSVDRSYIRMGAPTPSAWEFFDVTVPEAVYKVTQNNLTSRVDLVITPTANLHRKIVAVQAPATVAGLAAHRFNRINVTGKQYLIVTHRALRTPVGGQDPILAYQQYRESSAGGSYPVLVAEIHDIYDQYNYGDPSPIAIKRLISQGKNSLTNVLLIGKGRTVNQNVIRNYWSNPAAYLHVPEFVPTYGYPGGDIMYSTDLDASAPKTPSIPIGRINARTSQEVAAYLNKVKEMEALPYDQLWRKNIIQLSGGSTAIELTLFAGYIAGLGYIAEGDYLGANVKNRSKQRSSISEPFPISGEVNNGVGMVTLFGHSSNSITDIEIGTPNLPEWGYQNKGKYPFMLVNGCKAGEIFGNTLSFSEEWVSATDKGAIGFISHADNALSPNLKRYSDLIYQVGFADSAYFAHTIGEVMMEVSRLFISRFGSDDEGLTQVQQTILQGDPAIRIFGAEKPDFNIVPGGVYARSPMGGSILAGQDHLLLSVPIRNFGKTSRDSLHLEVTRTLPGGQSLLYHKAIPAPRRLDTLTLVIDHPIDLTIEGLNRFRIVLDPADSLSELNEQNNLELFELYITQGNTQNLFPPDLSIQNKDTITFKWHAIDLLEPARDYRLQIDTTYGFDSPFLIDVLVAGENLVSKTYPFNPLADSTVVFWRTQMAQASADTLWATSSFTLLRDSITGWAQYSFDQFQYNMLNGIHFDPVDQHLAFDITQLPVEINTMGTAVYTYDLLEVNISHENYLLTTNSLDPFCRRNTLNAVVFDRNTAQPYRPVASTTIDVYEPLFCGRLPQMVMNFTENDVLVRRKLDEMIANMKDGDGVVLFNFDSVAYSNWDATVVASLQSVGVDPISISLLTDGQPLIIFGKKGLPPGLAEIIKDDLSGLPAKQQTLRSARQVSGTSSSGLLTTSLVGPSRKWKRVVYDFEQTLSDNVSVQVIGMDAKGIETPINLGARTDVLDLTSVDARQYPFLKLQFLLTDIPDLTAPKLRYLSVIYDEIPEGMIYLADKKPITLVEGQDMKRQFGFVNVSPTAFMDSLSVNVRLSNPNLSGDIVLNGSVPPVAPGDTVQYEMTVPTQKRAGTHALKISFDPREQEQTAINNQLTYPAFATINGETTNPVLDVTIDGRYIMDGELVSAQPIIRIRLKDENPYLTKADTSGLVLSLKPPGDHSVFERIAFTDKRVAISYQEARNEVEILYRPGTLADGIHTLRVQGEDVSGNASGVEPYEIRFEVVNESTITHFYPYPNPFSTSCRFVFTLTGSTIPYQMKIQVMTISGRVVREIHEDEIGPVHIGNNITQFAWDGTDQFGDPLANGVYLYRVVIKNYGEGDVTHRYSAGDNAFTDGFGKLYILR